MELSTEAKKSKKPSAKDVYETAEEVKNLKKKIKDEKKKKNPNQEKIKEWEAKKKKKQAEKNRLKSSRKGKSSELFNWGTKAFKNMVYDNKETFFKSISEPFDHCLVGKEDVSLYGYHTTSPVKIMHQAQFNNNHYKKASEELDSIIPNISKITTKSIKSCFNNESIDFLNLIGRTNKLSQEFLSKLLKKDIEVNSNFKSELISSRKPNLQYKTWLLKIKSFEDMQKHILSNTERTEESFKKIGHQSLYQIPNVSIAIAENIKDALNKKLRYYKCIESRDENQNLVLSLESKFGTYSYQGIQSDSPYSLNCYIPKDYKNYGWEDCREEFMKTAIEANNVMEVDLSRPYMALSAIFGSSLRNQKEKRILSPSNLTNGLFYLTFMPEKKEFTKTFHFIYSARLSFEFIERIRQNLDNLDQRDVMLLAYEFGRVLAYYTFLLTINRTQAPVLNGLLEEVKVVLITLAELVIDAEHKDKFDDILGSDKDTTKTQQMDAIDNGEWKIGHILRRDFIKLLDDLDNYTDGTYNDIPFPFILSLAYTSLQYILLGIVPTTISNKQDITMNEFLMACKSDEIKNYVNRLVVNDMEQYSTRALYGMIYTYYKLRNYFSVVGLGVNPVAEQLANDDIFFSSLYKIGALLETDYLTKDDSDNKPYLVEILENGLFGGNIRLIDVLNINQVFNPSDDLVKVDDINVPFILTVPYNQMIYNSNGFNKNPLMKLVENALANGVGDSFDPQSVELYVMEYLSNVDCHIVSPYRIYKIAALAAMARRMYAALESSHTNDKELKNTLSNIIILCDSLIVKLYDEWFNTRSTIYRFETRMTDYPVVAFRNNKDKYLKWEIDLVLTYYGNYVIDINRDIDSAFILNTPWFVDINTISNKPNLVYFGETQDAIATKEAYNDFNNYITFKLPILVSITNPEVFGDKSIMIECLSRLNNQAEMFDKIKSLVTDALPLPQTSSKTEVVDAMYKDTAYPSAIFKKIISNVSTILERTDLTSEAKFYLTYCLIYSSIIRNHINNVLIRPNSNIATVDDKDDLVEMATQTSNSIESYISWIFKKAGIDESQTDKHGWF